MRSATRKRVEKARQAVQSGASIESACEDAGTSQKSYYKVYPAFRVVGGASVAAGVSPTPDFISAERKAEEVLEAEAALAKRVSRRKRRADKKYEAAMRWDAKYEAARELEKKHDDELYWEVSGFAKRLNKIKAEYYEMRYDLLMEDDWGAKAEIRVTLGAAIAGIVFMGTAAAAVVYGVVSALPIG